MASGKALSRGTKERKKKRKRRKKREEERRRNMASKHPNTSSFSSFPATGAPTPATIGFTMLQASQGRPPDAQPATQSPPMTAKTGPRNQPVWAKTVQQPTFGPNFRPLSGHLSAAQDHPRLHRTTDYHRPAIFRPATAPIAAGSLQNRA